MSREDDRFLKLASKISGIFGEMEPGLSEAIAAAIRRVDREARAEAYEQCAAELKHFTSRTQLNGATLPEHWEAKARACREES